MGKADPGTTVTETTSGLSAVASASGIYQIAGVPLAMGANPLTVQCTDAAGNVASTSITLTRGAAPAGGNPVLAWNRAALDAIKLDASDPPQRPRGLANAQAAVFDALNSIGAIRS